MTELKFALEFGECNGYMSVECYANGKLIARPDVTNPVVETKVNFPFDLTITVSGKNSNTDTFVEDNKITKDKYVKLNKIYLSRYPVSENVTYNLCRFESEQTTYFYKNGTATLNFQATDALRWHLLHNTY